MRIRAAATSALLACALLPSVAIGQGRTAIPLIGCPTSGQINAPAPPDTVKPVHLDPRLAARLSFYGDGVLGPRGWHCHIYVDDEGMDTFVTPGLLADPASVSGPAIMVFKLDSFAFGRFDAARIIARYFPRRWAYARAIMTEDAVPDPDFIFHPYRHDRFLARTGSMFEVETPPHMRGFGAENFVPDGLAVRSRLYFFDREEPGFLITRVRLPNRMNDLLAAILDAVHP